MSKLNGPQIATIIVFTIALILSSLMLISCPDKITLTEINRCLFINYKIDWAQQKLDDLDQQMALAYHDQLWEIEKSVYDFDTGYGRVLKTLIYYPKNKTDQSPVILFSHGFSGSAESQLYLIKGLARRGNIVIAPDHSDIINFDRIGFFDGQRKIAQSSTDLMGVINYVVLNLIQNEVTDYLMLFDPLSNLSAEELAALAESGEFLRQFDNLFHYRIEDIDFFIEKIKELNESDPLLMGKMDLNRLVLGGHSLGGYAAIYLARAPHPFKAFFCLSPATQPFARADLAKINAPIMYLTGDLDHFHNNIFRAFENTPSPKIFQSIFGGGHIIFNDRPFLYGLGLPFISGGEVGFTADLPFEKNNDLTSNYPKQLGDYQGKALTIIKSVSAFIDLYVNGDKRGLIILKSMTNDSFIAESIIEE